MNAVSVLIIASTSYKILSLLVGLSFAYFGYKLFMANIWGHAGDLKLEFSQNSLVLKKAAPGTFFAVLGAMIVVFVVVRGLDMNYSKTQKGDTETIGKIDTPPELPTN